MGNGVCQCPEPFNGPTCGSVTLIKVVKPTRRVFIEDQNNGIIAKLRRRAMSPYLRQIPQQVCHFPNNFKRLLYFFCAC